ncbi:protein FAM210B, mitochondrial isoform X2 [Girardinichthys multiradiatus]|uniref:protein FAM210B, mitochondrial isoform X2 n=1 Tax=Girardinichthys multiradiatus TaxID=208333 RepID=UPI001FAD8016|nr:protein FAM210B, mitochondrial isoform X2 [Girardinichthys multiradiatus]
MFLCRTRRLLVAALDQASERPGSFLVRVKANGPRYVSLTVRTGPTFQRLRFLSASTGGLEDLQEASSTSSTEKDPGNTPDPEEGKPSKAQQLKKVFKEYGAVGVSFHIGISLMSLGMFYLLISSGIDMTAMLYKLGFSEELVQSKMAAGTSTFVLAYAIHKLFAPVRMSITVVSVPLIVRYFRKTGLFKPPTPAP